MTNLIMMNLDRDPDARATRNRILRQAGFSVMDLASAPAALDCAGSERNAPVFLLLGGHWPDLDLAGFCRRVKEVARVSAFVLRLSPPVPEPQEEPADAWLSECTPETQLVSVIRAFAETLERRAADRRRIEQLEANLARLRCGRAEPESAGPAGEVNEGADGTAACRRMEGEPQRCEQAFATLADNLPDVVARLGRDLRYRYINCAVACFTGHLPEAFIGKTAREVLGGSDQRRGAFEELCRQVFSDGQERQIEFRERNRYHRCRVVPERDGDGRIETVLAITEDITAQKRAEEALKFDQALLEALQTVAPIGLGVVDRSHRFIRVNQALAEIDGISMAQHVGRSVEEIVPNLWPALERIYRRVLEHGETVANIEITGEIAAHPGVARHWLGNYYPLRVDGQVLASGIVVQDITARKRAEQALRESERRLELAVTGADLGIWDWDIPTGRVAFNARWATMLGFAPEDLDPDYRQWEALLHPDDKPRVLDAVGAMLEGGASSYESEFRLGTKTGDWKWVLSRGNVYQRDADGRALRAAGTHMDIAARKALEERLLTQQDELHYAQRLTTAGELAAMMAHELNQPLGAIANYLGGTALRFRDLLLEEPALNQVIEETLRLSKRAADVVDGIRGLVRRRESGREWLDVSSLVNTVLSLIRTELARKHIGLVLRVPVSLPPVWGQRVLLQQLLLNLVLNAVEALQTPGVVRRELMISAELKESDTVEISVSDSGPGLSPEIAPLLFERFVSSKPEGMGLGLSICRTIAEAHGGRISALSEPGQGATFTIALPMREASAYTGP